MSIDTRTPAEIAYDAERSGEAWLKVQAITDNPADDGSADEPLTDDEQTCLDIILRMPDGRDIPVIRSRNAAHREERWLTILEKIADLDEPEQSELIGYTMGLLDGMGMMKRTDTQ